MAKSSIEWTTETWNPIAGCSDVSQGCKNCYARKMAGRLEAMGSEKYRGLTVMQGSHRVWTGNIHFDEEALYAPLKRRKPTTYFVNSMSDLFHPNVAPKYISEILSIMALCPQHTFQVLTKRPERMKSYFSSFETAKEWSDLLYYEAPDRLDDEAICAVANSVSGELGKNSCGWPLKNLWIGTSVENQKTVDERIPLLLQTPAAVRFISAEPLLENIDLEYPLSIYPDGPPMCCNGTDCGCMGMPVEPPLVNGLDLVIVGGESGPGARPFDLSWARSVVQQCKRWNTPVFVKQLGRFPRTSIEKFEPPREDGCFSLETFMRLKDRKGGNMEEWPEDLQIRQMPLSSTL